jgi:hypothetical protein
MKMANIDAVFDFMFTNPKSEQVLLYVKMVDNRQELIKLIGRNGIQLYGLGH